MMGYIVVGYDVYEVTANIFKSLAHPTRVRILKYLLGGQRCVKEIWKEIGIPQPTASQHISVLKNTGVISYRKDGAKTCYKIEDDRVIEVLKIFLEEV